MHDEDKTIISLDICYSKLDFTQEGYIWDIYTHYKNQHLVVPLDLMPQWLREGIGVYSFCEQQEQEEDSKKRETDAKMQKLKNRR